MFGGDRLWAYFRRLHRIEQRELREFRAWIETTRNLIRLTSLVVIPLLLALVTFISHANPALSFLLFPPLASGTHTLFSDPEGKYSTPWNFVGGLTIGALCGWLTLLVPHTEWLPMGSVGGVSPTGAAMSIFLTGVVTWVMDTEISSAFSTALLVLLTGTPDRAGIYVLSIAVSSTLVAAVFFLWRKSVYAERAEYLYQSTQGDDHVLVVMRGEHPTATAMLGAQLASAHDAGKVVLLQLADADAIESVGRGNADDSGEDDTAHIERTVTDPEATQSEETDGSQSVEERAASAFASTLEKQAHTIRTKVGVPCEVVVASEGSNPARTVQHTAHETNCDLIAAPYETRYGSLSPFLRELFQGDTDVLVHRSDNERTDWKRVLVPVRRESDVAHSMIDFAVRLVGRTGHVSVAHCIAKERERRTAEEMLSHLTETATIACETRVARAPIESFLDTYARGYDLVIIGASQERSATSRFISPPTFYQIDSLDADVAILDRNYRM
ncbi:HPP family protein [Halocatena pleomorpha]|uniref:HPP family protein n=1 Tax=Halocatena pleomorpha TaxID=1785090 RepID=A0A3P3RAP6_9EURY|nr:HPP family protein [Halocatena pleomorpha]RRJ30536.1 HPP family protein [Halocatena pleomorpha]